MIDIQTLYSFIWKLKKSEIYSFFNRLKQFLFLKTFDFEEIKYISRVTQNLVSWKFTIILFWHEYNW